MRVERIRWRKHDGWHGDPAYSSADMILFFGSAESIQAASAPATLAERYPDAVILGCSTAAGILNGRIDEDGIVGVSCRFRSTQVRLAEAEVPDAAGSAEAGRRLGEALHGDGLAGALVLSDGVHVNGSAIATAMGAALGDGVPLCGGLAGDGVRFEHTLVCANGTARAGRAAAIGFYGDRFRMSHATAGGWDAFGPRRHITRSHGCVLEELDGKPALALYERYLGDEAAGLPGAALFFPLMVWNPEAPSRKQVRTIIAIDREAGSMIFAGDVPQGWGAQLMAGNFDRLVDGVTRAGALARDAIGDLPEHEVLALLVSCAGRQLLLGQRIEEELHAVDGVLGPEMTRIGFYSHGEIAPEPGAARAALHNQTMVVTLLAEAW